LRGGVHASELRRDIGLLTPDELGAMLSVTAPTLAQWRVEKTGPDYVKLGKSVFYRRADVLAWIQMNLVVTNRAKRIDPSGEARAA